MAKRRGSEIFNFVFNFVVYWNLVHLGDSEWLLCVSNMVCVCVHNVVCVLCVS